MEFKAIFNISNLSDHELGHLEFVLNSPSYIDVFVPYLQGMRNSLNVRLLDPSQKRKEEYNDDYLRGGITMIDGLLTFFHKLINETSVERIHRSQEPPTSEEQYNRLRSTEQIGMNNPALGHIVSESYNPDEDF